MMSRRQFVLSSSSDSSRAESSSLVTSFETDISATDYYRRNQGNKSIEKSSKTMGKSPRKTIASPSNLKNPRDVENEPSTSREGERRSRGRPKKVTHKERIPRNTGDHSPRKTGEKQGRGRPKKVTHEERIPRNTGEHSPQKTSEHRSGSRHGATELSGKQSKAKSPIKYKGTNERPGTSGRRDSYDSERKHSLSRRHQGADDSGREHSLSRRHQGTDDGGREHSLSRRHQGANDSGNLRITSPSRPSRVSSSVQAGAQRRKSGAPRKRRDRALAEIKRCQKETKLLMSKLPFARVVRDIAQAVCPHSHLRWQVLALEALQEAAEIYLVHVFEDALLCTIHRSRVTLNITDMRLARRIRSRFENF